jgi:hypothetical protein
MTPARDTVQQHSQDVAAGSGVPAPAPATPGLFLEYRWLAPIMVGDLVAAYVAVHLAPISSSRLPWFDDAFSASIADSVRRTGGLALEVSPLLVDGPVYLYGPMYFLTLAGVYEGFEVGLVQTRLPGLLCGFGILAVAYLIRRRALVREVGSDFHYLQRGGSDEERARFHAGPYGAEFVVTAEPDTSPLVQTYRKETRLVPVGTMVSPDGMMTRRISDVARRAGIGSPQTASYEGRVFARQDGARP